MNPNTQPQQLAPPPLPQPPQPHRLSTSCDRHPDEQFTGFCPSCLCERLAVLEPSSSAASGSSSKKPPISITTSTATAALKAIFKPSIGGPSSNSGRAKPGFFPELRRTKSFSASKNEGFGFPNLFEPQRKSCDVRVRNTLWSLFSQDDAKKKDTGREQISEIVEVENRNLASSSGIGADKFEEQEEEETDYESEHEDAIEIVEEEPNVASSSVIEEKIGEIVEEYEQELEQAQEDDLKPMKDHIDLDSHTKKPSGRDFKGSFWSAASVFSKKLLKWRQKQKLKKRNNGGGSARLPVEKPIGRQYRETQSEIADYGYGRRSCDTDPRFSLDAGRMSFDVARMSFDAARMSCDDPRYSFDEPRASWDGYLIGRTFPRMPTMLSVVEDAPVPVLRSDSQIPVEEPRISTTTEEESLPGGSVQTRDYYSDSSSRRRKSLDRSNSIRKMAAAVVAEVDEMKSASVPNSKVSPATIDGPKLVVPDRDLRDSNSNSLRDDCSETFEIGLRDNASVIGNGERITSKKSRRWIKGWNIWGFIHKRSVNKENDRYSRANGVERSFSESWQERNGGAFNPKVLRSNSSVSWRNPSGSLPFARKNNVETNGKKRRDEFVLERNRSARYSPNNMDNGLLRFYLTPLRGSRRSVGSGKSRPNQAQSIARSVLRLY